MGLTHQCPHGVRFHQRFGDAFTEGGRYVASYHITSIGGGAVRHKSPKEGGSEEESVEKLHVLVLVLVVDSY